MTIQSEVQTKLARARELMSQQGIDTLWLRRVANVAWITGGINTAVNTADVMSIVSIVITPDSAMALTDTIEAPRLRAEDDIEGRGFELHVSPWEKGIDAPQSARLGVDFPMPGAKDLSGDITRLRARLLPVEQDRFRKLAGHCAEAMHHAINRVKPGMNEYEIAAALEYETMSQGVKPVVTLVGVDDRIYNVRHPVPTDKIMEKYAMLVLCGRQHGLICSVTRLVHFGKLSDDLRNRIEACARVDAAMLAASQPGATLESVFKTAQQAYADNGFDGEWKLHHQGGLASYTPRDLLGVPGQTMVLEEGMVLAWNPSITGAKVEDSIMVTPAGQAPEILTQMYGWPTITVEVNGMTFERPVIMEV